MEATLDTVPRTPCLVVDLDVVDRNTARMLERAERLGCTLRPHVKTHKTVEVALMQTGGRRSKIVVSTLAEARFFAAGGFDDILYAVPISPDKLEEADALARQLGTFHVMVDSRAGLEALEAYTERTRGGGGQEEGGAGNVGEGGEGKVAGKKAEAVVWSVFVMVDCGYHRDG